MRARARTTVMQMHSSANQNTRTIQQLIPLVIHAHRHTHTPILTTYAFVRARALPRYISAEAEVLYDGWRLEILRIMAHIEAFIDFGDDEGIEDDVMQVSRE
jgi:hypothetical protein